MSGADPTLIDQWWLCECVVSCADEPRTACSLSGEPHVHPEWPCLIHPDAPGDWPDGPGSVVPR